MRTLLLSLCALLLAGCATPGARQRAQAPLTPMERQLASYPARDRVLWQYRLAAADIRAGRFDDAKSRLDDAIVRMGGIIANDENAQQARGIFGSENSKTYIGEPYERAMAYYYRGLLYWRDGELDNARACFRNAQFLDSAAVEQGYRGDYVLLDYLDGLATTLIGDDGADAYARAVKLAKQDLPPYRADDNTFFFVEFGAAPRKYADGEYGELLRFRAEPSRIRSAALTLEGGRRIHFTPWDNLAFQATTRGGRVMDYILGNKAVFKQGADAVGDAALAGAAIAAGNAAPARREQESRERRPPVRGQNARPPPRSSAPAAEPSEGSADTAIALGVIGLIGKVASAATNSEADTRTWDNLPQYLSFSSARLPAGAHRARLEFFDAEGKSAPELARDLVIEVPDSARDTVLILSEHKR